LFLSSSDLLWFDKVWECRWDVAEYLIEHDDEKMSQSSIDLSSGLLWFDKVWECRRDVAVVAEGLLENDDEFGWNKQVFVSDLVSSNVSYRSVIDY